MSSSSDVRRRAASVIRKGDAAGVSLAPIDTDLRMASSVMASIDPSRIEVAREEGFQQGIAEGRVEGFEQGLVEGRAAAAAEAAEGRRKLAAALTALREGAAQLSDLQVLELTAVEDQIVDAALALAEGVLGRELQLAYAPGREALARALALAPAGVGAVAHLHPDDAATLTGALDDLGREVAIVADPGVERGGCVLEAGDACIDAQLTTALARAVAVIKGQVPA
jgi:flagellar assembly protein FliH